MPKIFISYRRQDAAHQADRLYHALRPAVPDPKRDIFIDIDNIPAGRDFVEHLDAMVSQCEVLICLIGPHWMDARHPETGLRRLDDPNDFVRVEIASALKRNIPVAPVLLDGASMPAAKDLPDDLKPLTRRQAAQVRRETFDQDSERFIRSLDLASLPITADFVAYSSATSTERPATHHDGSRLAQASTRNVDATPPLAMQRYLNADFGPASHAAAKLREELATEATIDGAVPLSDLCGALPALLTPGMQTWYQQYVAPLRTSALQTLRQCFQDDADAGGKAKGTLYESELDRIEHEFVLAKRNGLAEVQASKQRLFLAATSLEHDLRDDQCSYAEIRARQAGRDPNTINWWNYGPILVAVAAAEGAINWEAFNSLSFATPAIAAGMAFLIGFAIAYPADMHGRLLRQWSAFFAADVAPSKRWEAIRMLSIASITLLVALGAVYYARDTFIAQTVLADSTFGNAPSVNRFWLIGGSLLGNILVYLAGAMIAYHNYDPVPNYPELKKQIDRKEKSLAAIHAALASSVQKKLDAALSNKDRQLRSATNIVESQKGSKKYVVHRRWFETFRDQDQAVVALLNSYRNTLVKKDDGTVAFIRPTENDPSKTHRLSARDYHNISIKLPLA